MNNTPSHDAAALLERLNEWKNELDPSELRIMIYLSTRACHDEPLPSSAAEIANAVRIDAGYAQKLLKNLARCRLVSHWGAGRTSAYSVNAETPAYAQSR